MAGETLPLTATFELISEAETEQKFPVSTADLDTGRTDIEEEQNQSVEKTESDNAQKLDLRKVQNKRVVLDIKSHQNSTERIAREDLNKDLQEMETFNLNMLNDEQIK